METGAFPKSLRTRVPVNVIRLGVVPCKVSDIGMGEGNARVLNVTDSGLQRMWCVADSDPLSWSPWFRRSTVNEALVQRCLEQHTPLARSPPAFFDELGRSVMPLAKCCFENRRAIAIFPEHERIAQDLVNADESL
jgi:hypothetical protein